MSDRLDILAIDGGGTTCRAAMIIAGRRFDAEAGSANASTNLDETLAQIEAVLSDLATQAGDTGMTFQDIPAYVGLAGAVSDQITARIKDRLPFTYVRVSDDRPAALTGALGDKDGGLIHCGTGSFLGLQSGGAMRFAGGWGSVLGDEGSAQWVGRKALRRTLDVADGIARPGPMTEHILAQHGSTGGIVAYAATARPNEFGSLAPKVTEAAMAGDPDAQAILQQGADLLAGDLKQMGWQVGMTLCLTGGIGPHFADYLPDEMNAALAPPNGSPLEGALALAAAVAREVGA